MCACAFVGGGVAGLVGIESGVVSGLDNPNDSALKRRWRPRHGKHYHEAYGHAFRKRNEHAAF